MSESTPLLSEGSSESSLANTDTISNPQLTAKVSTISHIQKTRPSHNRPSYPSDQPQTHKLGPQRTSYTTQKLKLLPEHLPDDEETGRDVYSQVTRIKEAPARKDAERLGKAHRALLPRVTAYCTAGSYKMKDLTRYLSGRKNHNATPRQYDECLYTPYSYRRENTSDTPENDLIRLDDEGGEIDVSSAGRSDIFLFEYGVVVFWGFTEHEERRFLRELAKFETEKLAEEDLQIEQFNYYITKSYQPRVSIFFNSSINERP